MTHTTPNKTPRSNAIQTIRTPQARRLSFDMEVMNTNHGRTNATKPVASAHHRSNVSM
jgi:hypothetical protein